ncbi:hypothetical protein PG991_014859 [Apiospora marii]|uniref:Uncharacterized protein n=1 Tax=Apiospora marii TaxID=335849 RepID=A0ABR1R6K8_9PEZI
MARWPKSSWIRGIRGKKNAIHPSGEKSMPFPALQHTISYLKRVAVASFHCIRNAEGRAMARTGQKLEMVAVFVKIRCDKKNMPFASCQCIATIYPETNKAVLLAEDEEDDDEDEDVPPGPKL